MRMLEDMDRRLLNWARYLWMMKSGGRMASPSFEARVDGEGWDAPTVIPTDDAEAEETHAGVMRMPSELRATTECWYLGTGGVEQKCGRLCVSETTLRERIGRAHRWLAQWLSDRRLLADRERERVEAARSAAVRTA
jgi:hypothetical protein